MRRLILTSSPALLAFFVLSPPAWAAWVWPLRGEVITPYSNGNDPYASGQHRGLDIGGETGQPVVAAASGSVRFAGTAGSSGVTVSIRTLDGFDTSYLHLSSASVREGQSVQAGERIGAVGTSGMRSAERPHLHFGVREAGSRHAYRDPLAFLPAGPPAAENPPAAPAPETEPAPLAPAPAPVTVPKGRRALARRGATIRRPRPSAQPAPARERVTAGGRVGAGQRAPAGRRVPSRVAAPPPEPIPHPRPARSAQPAKQPDRAHRPGHRPDPAPRSLERTGPSPEPWSTPTAPAPGRGGVAAGRVERAPAGGRPSGPDFGLVLACVGLLGAAALLGLSEDGRTATRRTRQRAAGLLGPLMGRR
jgi:Peptidase family M23